MIEPGYYSHYKGDKYIVDCIGKHTETKEWLVVYYPAIDLSKGERRIWIRPLDMFKEKVKVDGKMVPRFKKIKD